MITASNLSFAHLTVSPLLSRLAKIQIGVVALKRGKSARDLLHNFQKFYHYALLQNTPFLLYGRRHGRLFYLGTSSSQPNLGVRRRGRRKSMQPDGTMQDFRRCDFQDRGFRRD
jgi:hypothetical protein